MPPEVASSEPTARPGASRAPFSRPPPRVLHQPMRTSTRRRPTLTVNRVDRLSEHFGRQGRTATPKSPPRGFLAQIARVLRDIPLAKGSIAPPWSLIVCSPCRGSVPRLRRSRAADGSPLPRSRDAVLTHDGRRTAGCIPSTTSRSCGSSRTRSARRSRKPGRSGIAPPRRYELAMPAHGSFSTNSNGGGPRNAYHLVY